MWILAWLTCNKYWPYKDWMLDNTSVTNSKQEGIILEASKSCRFAENFDSVNMPPVTADISFSQMSSLRAKIKGRLRDNDKLYVKVASHISRYSPVFDLICKQTFLMLCLRKSLHSKTCLTGNPRIPHVTVMASPGSSRFPPKSHCRVQVIEWT